MSGPRPGAGAFDATLLLLLGAIAVLSVQLIGTLRGQQRVAQDRAELNNVKYELLNADAWVAQLTVILDKKVREFHLTPENRGAVKSGLERMLDTLITEADRHIRAQKTRGTWWKRTTGKVKQDVQDALVDVKEVKAGIPAYADQILAELLKPEARQQLDALLRNLLTDLSRSTFSEIDRSRLEAVHAAYRCTERPACQQAIGAALDAAEARAKALATALLGLVLALYTVAVLAPGRRGRNRIALLALCPAALLACGVLTPMIEVEARISQLRFLLLGEPVVFTDQVLYFQSKSVLDVVHVLTATGALDMVAVGILIMTFSVLFPLAKLGASFLWLYDVGRLRRSPVVRFFALKSGKWSMADVFVVAIFMAFIGFNGLISSQLSNLSGSAGGEVEILTTNGTALQIGFFMFLAFCLASLATSTVMDAVVPGSQDAGVET
ncbi:MAG TPA: paraquat-inducible protein A [Solimonas sp.]|nr:paraquat-inducible protein A [Solimonas sp.]